MDEKDNVIEISENLIDIERVIASKNPALLKMLPGFVINYLKRVIHQKELNAAIYANRYRQGLDFVDAILKEFGAKIITKGLENIPKEGRCVIASNHPLGGLDGVALLAVAGKVRKDVVIPSNDLLMNLPNMRVLFIPVNKHGSNSGNLTVFEESFSSDKTILYFPAGLCSRKQSGGIADLEWKKSFISKARKYQRDIIPTHIDGRNSNFFYNLANLRKRLGLKANIEMLYLVDEMYKQKNKEVKIIFGKPIPYQVFDKRFTDTQWAQLLKSFVYTLEQNPDGIFPYLAEQQ